MRNNTFFLSLFFAVFAAVACEMVTEPAIPDTPVTDASRYITIKVGYDAAEATRTSLAGGDGENRNDVVFVEGDRLLVYYLVDGEYVRTVFDMIGSPAEDGSADFGGNVSEGATELFALCPYDEGSFIEMSRTNGTMYTSIKQKQMPYASTYDPSAVLCYGCAVIPQEGPVSLTMHNLNALVKFSVPEGRTIKKAVLTSNGTEAIAGGMSIVCYHPGSQDVVGNFTASDDFYEVVLEGDEMTSGNWYYFSVIPQDLESGFTIKLYEDVDDKLPQCSRSTTKNVSLTRGRILNIGEVPDYTVGEWLGSGTAEDPYQISSLEQLLLLEDRFSNPKKAQPYQDKYFKQTNDIDCKGMAISIGAFSTESGYEHIYAEQGFTDWNDSFYQFSGTFDGCGHTISNYKLRTKSYSNVQYFAGLFCNTYNATIKNLYVRPAVDDGGIVYEAPDQWNIYCCVGALIGWAGTVNTFQQKDNTAHTNTFIENCHLVGGPYKVQLSDYAVYVVGRASSGAFGGLIGRSSGHLLMNGCSNEAHLTLSGGDEDTLEPHIDDNTYLGGLVGIAANSYSATFAGDHDGDIIFDRCRNNGSLTSSSEYTDPVAGGLVGKLEGSYAKMHISNCVNSGTVRVVADGTNDDAYAGGLIGYMEGSEYCWIQNCLNKGSISANGDDGSCGGMIGKEDGSGVLIALCVNTGSVSGGNDPHLGAFCGINGDTECVGCYWLESKDCGDGIEASVPYIYDKDKTRYKANDCYFYKTITCDHPNERVNRINHSPSGIVTGWSDEQWPSLAVRWTGTSAYGGQNDLDLDFICGGGQSVQ